MGRPKESLKFRLRSKLKRVGDCLEWQGSVDRKGYGRIMRSYPPIRWAFAHRVAMEISLNIEKLPSDVHVLHKCDNPRCCDLDHLFLGNHQDNMRDMDAKGRRVNTPHDGSDNGMAKLSDVVVLQMRELRSNGLTYTEIGRIVGVHKSTAARAVQGLTWGG